MTCQLCSVKFIQASNHGCLNGIADTHSEILVIISGHDWIQYTRFSTSIYKYVWFAFKKEFKTNCKKGVGIGIDNTVLRERMLPSPLIREWTEWAHRLKTLTVLHEPITGPMYLVCA